MRQAGYKWKIGVGVVLLMLIFGPCAAGVMTEIAPTSTPVVETGGN